MSVKGKREELLVRALHRCTRLESVKLALARRADFHPVSAFAALDVERKGYLTLANFQQFIEQTGTRPPRSAQLSQIWAGTVVIFEKFQRTVLPSGRPDLLRQVFARDVYRALTPDTEKVLAHLFQIQEAPDEVPVLHLYTLKNLFESIPRANPLWLTAKELQQFLQSYEVDVWPAEVDQLLASVGCETKLSSEQFVEFFMQTVSSPDSEPETERVTYVTASEDSCILDEPLSPVNSDEFVLEFLQTQLETLAQTEVVLKKLALRPDFNLKQAWLSLDVTRTGTVTATDFVQALQSAGVEFTPREVWKVVALFDSNRDGALAISDMAAMFGSRNPEYLALVRSSRGVCKAQFSSATQALFRELFVSHLAVAQTLLGFPHRCSARTLLDTLDVNGDGFVSVEDLDKYLNRNSVYVSAQDLLALFTLFDWDKDSCISITDLKNLFDS